MSKKRSDPYAPFISALPVPKLPTKMTSDVAILDVTKGRHAVAKYVRRGQREIEVVVRGKIIAPWGSDDGVSIEFEMKVDSVEVLRPQTVDGVASSC